MEPLDVDSNEPAPLIWRWVVGFILVGMAWGFTTPFIRRAAVSKDEKKPSHRPLLPDPNVSWLKRKTYSVFYSASDLLKNPAYSIPLLLNVSGSVWFFLLIGQAELSLMVPITNSLAFLFTVIGEWWAEGKVISRDTWVGMTLVLAGIALCVYSKS